jgi:hypothetical protein
MPVKMSIATVLKFTGKTSTDMAGWTGPHPRVEHIPVLIAATCALGQTPHGYDRS